MPIIDRNTFNELKQISGEEFINELIDTFLEDAPKMIVEMKTALEDGNADSFRRAAHSMKSNAATFGANDLYAFAKDLEMLGRENKLSEAGSRFGSLEEAYASVRMELGRLKSA
jgi:HPt (histidine-containing phosphotransfer) domain-containing protein